ncbi:hypothetical protein LO772_32590 [Yinghuangia sp. ASG 101]|uniref:hypothetical protein n=1 Tax=Yinghuangia sp. ASG 101 TaxID=2896848 RepID=UPI001E3E8984|nr:hypothetical protein [Yinghuangia sp. ASG 101]UGQ11472.1 hypothetical protein LO772_32590 [Yinghuangia sp. ASG 101]
MCDRVGGCAAPDRLRDLADQERDLNADWLVAATIALGHTADRQIRMGRLDARAASRQLRSTVMRLYGARGPAASR